MSRLDVVQEARSWLGTPYVHQQACKGAGCDCLGLVRGVWRGIGGADVQDVPAYTMDWSECSGDEPLLQAARLQMCPAGPELAEGDLLLFRMVEGAVAKHLGILVQTGPQPRFIHAYSGHGVVESSLSLPWRRRIAARFAFPTFHQEN